MKKNKIDATEKDAYFKSVRGLEAHFLLDAKKSKDRAWLVAGVATALAFAAFGLSMFIVTKYAQPISEHILTINKDTGEAQEVSLLPKQAQYSEVIDKYWISQYVNHRETYDYYGGEADYIAVGLMSTNTAAEDYRKKYLGADALDKRWQDSVTITVRVKSIILDQQHGTATVRYTTTKRRRQLSKDDAPKYWIATIGYEYSNFPLTAAERYINPLGFRVLSFRTTEENSTQVGN